jgi:hydroxypyruvate reductase
LEQERLTTQNRDLLLAIFQAALAKVEGAAAVASWLRENPIESPLRLVAIGKAAQSMALGAQEVLGDQIESALIITKTDHLDSHACQRLGWEGIEASHPVPDAMSLQAGERLLAFLAEDAQLPLLILISGGASSLLEVPVKGVDLDFLARANSWLLGSGLDIVQMNRVRKALSRVKGGGLLSAIRGREIYALAISDVPGDAPAAIGSGLLVPEPDLADKVSQVSLPDWLQAAVESGLAERSDGVTEGPEVHIVANLALAKEAAVERASESEHKVFLHQEFLDGEAGETGDQLASLVKAGEPGIHIWGGETTVQLPEQPGRGGRNQHLALSAAVVLSGSDNCYLLAGGTDGTDGPTEDAGALVDGGTLQRIQAEGIDVSQALKAADAGSALEASGDLITTGPTGTNVMDLVIGLKC